MDFGEGAGQVLGPVPKCYFFLKHNSLGSILICLKKLILGLGGLNPKCNGEGNESCLPHLALCMVTNDLW